MVYYAVFLLEYKWGNKEEKESARKRKVNTKTNVFKITYLKNLNLSRRVNRFLQPLFCLFLIVYNMVKEKPNVY
jgi:hypothetical protein